MWRAHTINKYIPLFCAAPRFSSRFANAHENRANWKIRCKRRKKIAKKKKPNALRLSRSCFDFISCYRIWPGGHLFRIDIFDVCGAFMALVAGSQNVAAAPHPNHCDDLKINLKILGAHSRPFIAIFLFCRAYAINQSLDMKKNSGFSCWTVRDSDRNWVGIVSLLCGVFPIEISTGQTNDHSTQPLESVSRNK